MKRNKNDIIYITISVNCRGEGRIARKYTRGRQASDDTCLQLREQQYQL